MTSYIPLLTHILLRSSRVVCGYRPLVLYEMTRVGSWGILLPTDP